MDRILLNEDDVRELFAWKEENKDLVRRLPAPLKAVEICLPNHVRIKAIRKDLWLDMYVYFKAERIGRFGMKILTGSGAMKMEKISTILSKDEINDCLSCYCSLMAYMVYETSEIVTAEPRIAHGNSAYSGYASGNKNRPTYILRRRTERPKVSLGGHHASPKGIFSVRGHFRKYKTGKTVWIEEYLKGQGEKKSKTYKMGKRDKEGVR